MAKYAVRRISLGSTLKFGFVLGLVVSLVPSLLCGLGGSWLVSTTHRIMEGWRDVRLEILGQPIRFDLIDLLSLEDVLEQLRFLDQNDWLFALLLVLVTCCVAALVLGLSANLLTLGYNALAWLTGGLIVELRELDDGQRRRVVEVEHIERPLIPQESQPLLGAAPGPEPIAPEEELSLVPAPGPEPIAPEEELSLVPASGPEPIAPEEELSLVPAPGPEPIAPEEEPPLLEAAREHAQDGAVGDAEDTYTEA